MRKFSKVEVTNATEAAALLADMYAANKLSASAYFMLDDALEAKLHQDDTATWIKTKTSYECSKCEGHNATPRKFCPNCGRKMIK